MIINFRTSLALARKETWPFLNCIPPIGSYVYSKNGIETKVESIEIKYHEEGTDVDVWLGLPFPVYEDISQWEKRMKAVLTYMGKVV